MSSEENSEKAQKAAYKRADALNTLIDIVTSSDENGSIYNLNDTYAENLRQVLEDADFPVNNSSALSKKGKNIDKVKELSKKAKGKNGKSPLKRAKEVMEPTILEFDDVQKVASPPPSIDDRN